MVELKPCPFCGGNAAGDEKGVNSMMQIPNDMSCWTDFMWYITEPAAYEALAEECTELAKAALKMARVLRGENPTPVSEQEASEMVCEEFTDVISCAIALGLEVDDEQSVEKFRRMQERHAEAVDGGAK